MIGIWYKYCKRRVIVFDPLAFNVQSGAIFSRREIHLVCEPLGSLWGWGGGGVQRRECKLIFSWRLYQRPRTRTRRRMWCDVQQCDVYSVESDAGVMSLPFSPAVSVARLSTRRLVIENNPMSVWTRCWWVDCFKWPATKHSCYWSIFFL